MKHQVCVIEHKQYIMSLAEMLTAGVKDNRNLRDSNRPCSRETASLPWHCWCVPWPAWTGRPNLESVDTCSDSWSDPTRTSSTPR